MSATDASNGSANGSVNGLASEAVARPAIKAAGAFGAAVTGFGAYRPAKLLGNPVVAETVGRTSEWIEERTGILTRHHASVEEDLLTMASAAGAKALAMSAVDPAEVDLVILATSSKKQNIPGLAAQVATGIGSPDAGAFDLNAVCAGFTYSLSMASNAVRLGEARNVVVVAAERTTDYLDPESADTYVIFADGAGAVVVSRSDEPGIGPAAMGSDGGRHGVLGMRHVAPGVSYVTMHGPLVYKWSTAVMPDVAHRACALAGVDISDIDWFVPHQANRRIVDTLARLLGFPDDRVSRDVVNTGNTSAASVPLALSRLYESGRTSPGDLALVLGFGAGLTYAGQVFRMP